MRLFALAVFMMLPGIALGDETPRDRDIAEAVLPLPQPLRAGATLVSYDADGKRTVLRKGTNELVCRIDGPEPELRLRCDHRLWLPETPSAV